MSMSPMLYGITRPLAWIPLVVGVGIWIHGISSGAIMGSGSRGVWLYIILPFSLCFFGLAYAGNAEGKFWYENLPLTKHKRKVGKGNLNE